MTVRSRHARPAVVRSAVWLLLAACSAEAPGGHEPESPLASSTVAEARVSSEATVSPSASAPPAPVAEAAPAPAASSAPSAAAESSPAPAEDKGLSEPGPTGLVIRDIKMGTGRVALRGTTLKVHYVGTLADGHEFDSSRRRKEPFRFELGKGHVIRGWEEGIVGMKVGGIRRLVIGPQLAYGALGHPPTIPPSATLVFEVELLEVR